MEFSINKIVQFKERTTVSKDEFRSELFDIIEDNITDNKAYCQALISKVFELPYSKLPDLFLHHCSITNDPIKWLNKFEKLIADNEELFVSSTNRGRMIKCYTIIESQRKEIEQSNYKRRTPKWSMRDVNAGCETRYFSFKETQNSVNELSRYIDKIIFLTKEKFDYEQASIDFINPNLPDYAVQCQIEIDHIQHLNCLTNEFSVEQMQRGRAPLSFNKLKINCNINQLVDIFYRLNRELFIDGKPIVEGSLNDITAIIVNSFTDKNGKDLSLQTVKTMLTPSKVDKRPKEHKKIDIEKNE